MGCQQSDYPFFFYLSSSQHMCCSFSSSTLNKLNAFRIFLWFKTSNQNKMSLNLINTSRLIYVRASSTQKQNNIKIKQTDITIHKQYNQVPKLKTMSSSHHHRYHLGTFCKCLNRKADIFESLQQGFAVTKMHQIIKTKTNNTCFTKLKPTAHLILTCSG